MTAPANWIEALSGSGRATARILFARLGIVARCRALTSEELAECIDFGGERGARYAIYLSCQELREAGEQLRLRGEIISPFDITRGIPYADAIAAAGIIVRLSGGSEAMIRMLEDEESDEEAISRGMDGQSIAVIGEPALGNPFAASAACTSGQAQEADSFFALLGQEIAGGFTPEAGTEEAPDGENRQIGGLDSQAEGLNSEAAGWQGLTPDSVWDEADGILPRAGMPRAGMTTLGDQADRLARILADRLLDAAGNI